MVWFDYLTGLDLLNRQFLALRDQLRQHALVIRVEMLHHNESHSGVGGECVKQLRVSFEIACGSSNGYDRKRTFV
jgi:hypothetical protein